MADANANIRIDVDTSAALNQIKELQRQISIFHSRMAQSGKAAAAQSAKMQANLINSINATKGFSASMTTIRTATESFTNSLEKNKFSMGEYFRYAGASTKTFGRLFKSEFETIGKVARERVKDLQTQYIKMGRDANGAMKAIKVRPTTLDLKDLGTQTAIAAQKQQLFNALMKQGSTNLLNFGKNTQWAGRQLMVGFTIPLTIMGATAAREFMKLEEQAIRFKRVYGDMFTSDKETQQALNNVRELAREFTKFGVAVEDTIDLAASVAQMGAMGSDLTNQVTQATRLAVLGGIEQQEALDTTISLTNAFGLATEELAGKIAFLNAAENQTILSIEDFNEAIPKAGSVVKQLGGDVEDLAYFLTAMREGGINASQSANALKSSLARLINPTEVAREKLAGFGIDILGIVEDNAGNLRETIRVLAVELDKLDPLNKSRAIEQLFGKFQFARMSTLFENIVKDGSQANKVLELTTNSTEELAIIAERELARVSDSPLYKFRKALEEFQASLAPVGEAFLKLATPLIEFGNRVLDQFNNLSDGTKQFITGAVAIGGVVAPALIMVVGLIANAIANTIKFGMMVKGAFDRTSNSSKILTDQYQYMNSEQIEAAAVAASLDQVHAKLRQTFTSEAMAVQKLVEAYDRAIVKQNQMAASGAAFGPRGGAKGGTKKYADGVVSVPGPKGAGDIIPAMLSPGEAVIPADMARKYAPLIQNMISGNIPGYAKGISDVNFSHYGADQRVTAAQAAAMDLPGSTAGFVKDLAAAAPDAEMRAIGSWGFMGNARLNRQAARSGAPADAYIQDFQSRSTGERLGEAIGFGGGDLADNEMMADFEAYDKDLQERMIRARKDGAEKFVDTRDQLAAIRKREGKDFDPKKYGVLEDLEAEAAEAKLKGTKAGKVRSKARSRIRDLRWNTNKELNDQLSKSEPGRRVLDRITRKSGPKSGILRGSINRILPRTSKAQLPLDPEKERIRRTKDYNDGLSQSARTASESKRTKKIAKDTVDGYANELERGKKKVTKAGKKQTQAQLAAEEAANKRSEAARRGWETRRANQEAAANKKQAGGRGRLAGVGTRFRGMGGKIAGVGAAASSMAMMASMMPGKVGEQAQKLMMPIMGLSAVLPMLTSKAGLATVAIGALVTGIVMANMSFSAAQEKAMALTESLGGGSKAMEEFSKAAGKASAGEVMDKRRENAFGIFQIQPGKNTFGSSFMGSDAGQAMKADVTNSIKTQGSAATQKLVTNQLATAIAAGALDPAQARSIINSLSQELGDYSFGIGVNAELIELLGPNGENLAKDPLKIRMEILKESEGQLQTSFENLNEAASRSLGDNISTGVGIAAGATAGALGGAIAGAFLAPFTGGLSVAIGAGVGALVGGVAAGISDLGGFIGSKITGDPSRRDRIGSASGASVAMNKIALQQMQEMSDSLELEYEQRIANAEAAGDAAEVERLINQRIEDRVALLNQNRQLIEQMAAGYSGASGEVQKALDTGVDKAMTKQYEGTALEDVVPLVRDIIGDNVEDKETQYLLKMQVASGEIGPLQMLDMLESFDKGSIEQDAIVNMITNMGGAFTNQAMGVINLLEDKELKADMLLNIDAAGSPEKAMQLLEFYQQLSATDSVLDREAKFRFIMENPAEAALLQKQMADIKALAGEVTVDVVAQILNAEAVDALNNDLDYFNSLSNDMKKIYLQTLVTTISTVSADDPALQGWLNAEGSSFKNSPPGVQLAEYANYNAGVVTKIAMDTTEAKEPTTTGGGGGGGPKASVFDDLTKKIRDLRLETFKAQKGWTAATNALNNLFEGGKSSIKVFDGLANKMRSLGVGEGMIEKILGMDPDEYEKRKGELFQFDANGQITGLTSKFKSLAAAVHSVTMGEYVNSQEAFIANTNAQFTAMNKLTAAGMSFVDAYEMVQDQALAAAIAMAATKEEIDKLIEVTELMNELAEKKSIVDEEAQAVDAVKKTNKEFLERYKALSKISKDSGLSDDQITAILSDPNLTKLYLNPSLDPNTLEQRLRQAEAQANLELRLKVATEEGKEALFDELMGDINAQFARKEEEIDVNFRLKTEDDTDIVREAENKIAAIQFEIDDYQAELEGIADQEDAINERYEKRFEALDKVGEANERIARAQQAQLDVADALSRGDIAAAARAQQQLRDEEAQASVEERRTQLERQQAAELANVRSTEGRSRKDIEDAIDSRQDQISKIQEDELEPAQERIRIAEYQRDVELDGLEIAGRTRDEWDKIANSVDLATVNMEDFNKKIEQALALFEYFVNGKPLDDLLFGQDELDRLIEEGTVKPEDIVQIEPEDIIPEDVKAVLDQGDDLEDDVADSLNARQKAAVELYKLGKLQEAAENIYSPVKSIASKASAQLAKAAGVTNADGTLATSADNADRRIQALKDSLADQARTASKAFADAVGTVNPDRLDEAYNRALASQGISTNVGSGKTPVSTTAEDRRLASLAPSSSSKPKTVTVSNTPVVASKPKTYTTSYNRPAPKPAPAPIVTPARQKAITSSAAAFASSGMSLRAYMRSSGGVIPGYNVGGMVKGYARGGLRIPTLGSDRVPAMLSPGEFVIRRPAVNKIGLDKLEQMNRGTYTGGSVYNYNLAVNVKSDANPDKIARTVMREIKRVESQRVRGNRF